MRNRISALKSYLVAQIKGALELGIHEGLSESLAARVRLTNVACILLSLCALPYAVIFYSGASHVLGFLVLPLSAAYFSCLFLTATRHYTAARMGLLLVFNIGVLFYCFSFGEAAQIDYLFMSLLALPFALFEIHDRKWLVTGSLVPTVFLIVTTLSRFRCPWIPHYDLSPAALRTAQIMVVLTASTVAVFSIGFLAMVNARTEENLRASSERLSQVTSNIAEVFWLADLEKNTMVYVSPAYETIWQRTCESLYADPKSFLDAIHEDDRPKVIEALSRQASGKYDEIYRIVLPNGDIRWIRDRAFPVTDSNGKIYRVCGVARDITEMKLADERRRESEKFLSALIENVPGMVYAKDLTGRYILSNRLHYTGLGKTRAQVVGHLDEDLFTPEMAESCLDSDHQVLQTKLPYEGQERALINNQEFTFNTIKFPLFDDEGQCKGICGISMDVTAKVQMEQQIREQEGKIILASKLSALGEMAAGIAHEVNSPLATVLMHVEQIQDIISEPSPDVSLIATLASRIGATTQRLAKIIRSLRLIARDGSLDPMVEYEVPSIIDETTAFCAQRFKNHRVELKTPAHLDHLMIKCRPTEIFQVLLNLLNNAFDAVEKLDQRWIKLEVDSRGDFVEFCVTDSGPGIPEHIQKRLFTPFFTTKEMGKGTGLGLNISQEIIAKHGGTLTLDTTCRNTRFVIRLPLLKAESTMGPFPGAATHAS